MGTTKFNTLDAMLKSYATDMGLGYGYGYDLSSGFINGVQFDFAKGIDVWTVYISSEKLDSWSLNSLFELVKNDLRQLRERDARKKYIDADIAATKELYRRFINATYGKCGIRPDGFSKCMTPKKNPYPYAWGKVPEIKDVKFADPATIVFWTDGTKTVVRAQNGDTYDPEKGLAMAICKKRDGNKWSYYNTFLHWLKKYKPESGDVEIVTHTTKVIKED